MGCVDKQILHDMAGLSRYSLVANIHTACCMQWIIYIDTIYRIHRSQTEIAPGPDSFRGMPTYGPGPSWLVDRARHGYARIVLPTGRCILTQSDHIPSWSAGSPLRQIAGDGDLAMSDGTVR